MIRFFVAYLLIAAVPANAGAQEAVTAPVSGRVVDAASLLPVEGALVRLPEAGMSATSDGAGFFGLPGVPVGRQMVLVSRVGYEVAAAEWEISADGGEVEVRVHASGVVLDELLVRVDQFRRRRESSSHPVRGFVADELTMTGTRSIAEFLAERANLLQTPCGALSTSGPTDCLLVRGRPTAPCITIDETRALSGWPTLEMLHPSQVYSVDVVSGGKVIQVYTVEFVRQRNGVHWEPASVNADMQRHCLGLRSRGGVPAKQ